MVATGDLAIHTSSGDYDYGVDINLADRQTNGLVPAPLPTTVGQGLYNTTSTNWYTTNAANAVTAVTSPNTNFYGAGLATYKLGDVTVQYLNTQLREGYDVTLATGDYSQLSTWEVDITIPLAMMPAYADMEYGDERVFAVTFAPGCRNDGNANRRILRLEGDVRVVPEPGTWALMLLGVAALVTWGRRRTAPAQVPADQTSSTPSGGQWDR